MNLVPFFKFRQFNWCPTTYWRGCWCKRRKLFEVDATSFRISFWWVIWLITIKSVLFIGTSLIIFAGHEDIVRALIQSGANVNAEDRNKKTPLHRAAHKGTYRWVFSASINSELTLNLVSYRLRECSTSSYWTWCNSECRRWR